MSRIKISAPVISTREEAESLLGEIARLSAERKSLASQMDEELIAVRSKYDERLSNFDQAILEKATVLESWADDRRTTDFAKRQSMDFLHGSIGYRVGNRTVKPKKGWTFDRVLEKLKELKKLALEEIKKRTEAGEPPQPGPDWNKYIRVTEEVNKSQILIDSSGDVELLTKEALDKIGLTISQPEPFYVEPKLESDKIS